MIHCITNFFITIISLSRCRNCWDITRNQRMLAKSNYIILLEELMNCSLNSQPKGPIWNSVSVINQFNWIISLHGWLDDLTLFAWSPSIRFSSFSWLLSLLLSHRIFSTSYINFQNSQKINTISFSKNKWKTIPLIYSDFFESSYDTHVDNELNTNDKKQLTFIACPRNNYV